MAITSASLPNLQLRVTVYGASRTDDRGDVSCLEIDIADIGNSLRNLALRLTNYEVPVSWKTLPGKLVGHTRCIRLVNLDQLPNEDFDSCRNAVAKTSSDVVWSTEMPLTTYLKLLRNENWRSWLETWTPLFDDLLPGKPCVEKIDAHIYPWSGCHELVAEFAGAEYRRLEKANPDAMEVPRVVVKKLRGKNGERTTVFDNIWDQLDEKHRSYLRQIAAHPRDETLTQGYLDDFHFCVWDETISMWRWFSPLFGVYVRTYKLNKGIASRILFLGEFGDVARETIRTARAGWWKYHVKLRWFIVMTCWVLSVMLARSENLLLAPFFAALGFFSIWNALAYTRLTRSRRGVILVVVLVVSAASLAPILTYLFLDSQTIIGNARDYSHVILRHSRWLSPGDTLNIDATVFCRENLCDDSNKVLLDLTTTSEQVEFRQTGSQTWARLFPTTTWGGDKSDSTSIELTLLALIEPDTSPQSVDLEVKLTNEQVDRVILGSISLDVLPRAIPIVGPLLRVRGLHQMTNGLPIAIFVIVLEVMVARLIHMLWGWLVKTEDSVRNPSRL